MKKKTLALVLAFTMTAALFTGCGSKKETETTQTQTETTAETESEEVDDQAAADEVAALIDAIYVQTRNENTDEQCAAAKAAWDKLTDAQKELVEGENADPDYFGRDTGDASKDDPLNEDGIGENELLVVSFGTSFNDSRAEDIGGVEKALQEANPDWSVRRAFTAQIIINHVQARDGEKIDNVEQALDRAVENGVKNLVVQPTHLMHGAEYDELVDALDGYKDKFETVTIAEPLLGEVGSDATVVNEDKAAVAEAITAEAVKTAGFDSLEAAKEDGTAFVFMGHGTSHTAKVSYSQMAAQMEKLGYDNVFIGTVEGEPEETACENVPIRMRVIYASQRIEFTTGYRIDVAKWDADKQRVKNGCTNKLKQNASEINADLLKYYAEMQNVFKEFEVQETIPTTQQLKDAFNLRMKDSSGEQQEEAQISFWEVFDEFVKECGNQNNWTASTYEKFAAVRNHIKEFKEDVTFEYFNEFGLNEYVNFLRDKKDMRNSTIGKQMGFLKWFLRWSFKKGHHQNIAYDAFKPKLKTTPKKVIFLTWDELNKLKDYQIPHDKQYLERVRDVFLFCCFTSLRYSDVRNLKRSDIKPDHIEVTTVKTADSLIIELNDHSKAILEKYKDVHFENHMALPVISNQKMNDYLKELGELAEINEPVRETYYKGNERIDEVTPKYALLSTHAGRKTFICNALALGIPAPVVMKWTGHSDYKAMKPYIDIADDIRANAMNKFNQL